MRNPPVTEQLTDADRRRAELVEIVRKHGVCPSGDSCKPPVPESDDCAGCLMAWAALTSLELGE